MKGLAVKAVYPSGGVHYQANSRDAALRSAGADQVALAFAAQLSVRCCGIGAMIVKTHFRKSSTEAL